MASLATLDDSAGELARRILAQAERQAISLEVRNASSLAPAEVTRVRQALVRELPSGAAPGQSAAVTVTLSENVQGYVWIAELLRGEKREVIILSVARAPAPRVEPPLSLERQFLAEEAEPILDAAVLGDTLLVLEPARLWLYGRASRGWERAQSLEIPQAKVWPRDVRGRLQEQAASFRAWLPGLLCTGTLQPSPALQCAESAAPWPVEPGGSVLASGRNYFLADGLPPFFSSARAGDALLIAGADGGIRVYAGQTQAPGAISGWGSDLAAVETRCGGGRQVLATHGGESGEADSVQAFEITDGQPAAASAPVEFSGPVTALWTAPGNDGAVAVVRDLKKGTYAAYRLSISCSR